MPLYVQVSSYVDVGWGLDLVETGQTAIVKSEVLRPRTDEANSYQFNNHRP